LAYAAIELAVLIFWRTRIDLTTHFTMAAASLSFVTAVYVVGLSVLEHDRSVRPSALLTVYLLLSILFSAAQTRTLFLMKVFSDIPAVVTASLGIKIVLLMLELQTKRRYLKAPFKHYSDETTSGLLDWSFLTWLNGLFRLGFRKLLTFDDLSRIDEKFRSGPMRERILFHWNARSECQA
jgi:ATP-binding cassette subfamily C (CFTR/MRP) protein 1